MFNYDIRVQQSDPDRVSATNQPIKMSMSCVNGNESIFISDLIQLESTDFPEMPPQQTLTQPCCELQSFSSLDLHFKSSLVIFKMTRDTRILIIYYGNTCIDDPLMKYTAF